jgi:hypothetical protein
MISRLTQEGEPVHLVHLVHLHVADGKAVLVQHLERDATVAG